jgi:hypothetical protein
MDQGKSKAKQALSGTLLAVAAAQLFLSAPGMTDAAESDKAKVHCTGANACKGKSECSSARNSCSGQNACKGQGWASMSEKRCLAKGGKAEKG